MKITYFSAALWLVLGVAGIDAVQAAGPAAESFSETLVVYVAKGRPDTCGRGCDIWIAVEGKVDAAAAPRVQKFLRLHKDRKLPIYFHSPGGHLEQAFVIGRMLRARKMVARVGRTQVNDCEENAQTGEACLKLKQSGRELDSDLITRRAICTSACPFMMFGAVTREVAPDALLGVHSPHLSLFFNGKPTQQVRADAMTKGLDRIAHSTSAYLSEMGIDRGLFDVQKTVKFESMHILTRDEIFGFGIDRREFAETPWLLEKGAHAFARKLAVEKNDGQNSYRVLQWRLACIGRDEFFMDYRRQIQDASLLGAVSIFGIAETPVYFKSPPTVSMGYETWSVRLPRASLESLVGLSQFAFVETSTQDAQRQLHFEKPNTEGLAVMMTDLLASCPSSSAARQPVTDDKAHDHDSDKLEK